MKRIIYTSFLFVLGTNMVRGQWLTNSDFAQFTCTYPFSCLVIKDGCATNWYVSHGSPQVFGTNGAASNYGLMWNNGVEAEGMWASYSFVQNKMYTITIKSQASSGPPANTGGYYLFAANNIADNWECGGGDPIPTVSDKQQIAHTSMTANTGVWTITTYTFTANANYGQIWMYPYVTGSGPQYIWYVDYITICPDICLHTEIFKQGAVPSGETKAGEIHAGTTAGTGGTGIVTVWPNLNTTLTAAIEVKLLPEFSAEVSTGEFIAQIIPCEDEGSRTSRTTEFPKIKPEREVNPNDFAIFPNPANDLLRILPPGGLRVTTVEIINTLGIVVYKSGRSSLDKRPIELDIGHLAPGMYFVRLNRSVVKKFQKID
ncbi:MAG TPA: T9SS type A sorting domain-containing protein [Chitinophagaceae bacterium]|nr:T9SS type A sorting domain-containing protein [Chitinophagaceae bacterium]